MLGLVSLLNDAASEMITPLLPIFLTATLGAGPAVVGLVEGLAEATANILKLVSGRLADRGVAAKSLVLGGYSLSNGMRPLIGLASAWGAVLLLRFLNVSAKGIRTAPRDALIASSTSPDQRGRAFGFHRSMDHAGAVIGPLLAFGLLSARVDLAHVFYASAIPGALALLLLAFGLPPAQTISLPAPPRFSWGSLHGRLKAMIVARGAGPGERARGVRRALGATIGDGSPMGAARVGSGQPRKDGDRDASGHPLRSPRTSAVAARRLECTCGRADVARAIAPGWWLGVDAVRGLPASLAMTEPAERSLIGDHAAASERGTAYGLYHLASGLLALPGALLFGVLGAVRLSHGVRVRRAVTILAAPDGKSGSEPPGHRTCRNVR